MGILEKLERAWEALLGEIYNPFYGTSHESLSKGA